MLNEQKKQTNLIYRKSKLKVQQHSKTRNSLEMSIRVGGSNQNISSQNYKNFSRNLRKNAKIKLFQKHRVKMCVQ